MKACKKASGWAGVLLGAWYKLQGQIDALKGTQRAELLRLHRVEGWLWPRVGRLGVFDKRRRRRTAR
jgi:hypothetical protein